jgi:hypothetical protein
MKSIVSGLKSRANFRRTLWANDWRLIQINRKVTAHSKIDSYRDPVAFFNASTRLYGISLNAAYSFLAACAVQLAGSPVVHFACRSGMTRCVLGTQKDDHLALPPCDRCISQSRWLYANAPTLWFSYQRDDKLAGELKALDLEALSTFEYDQRPLGELVLPALRWALRRHHLLDDESTRFLLREYLLSAHNVAVEFQKYLAQVEPSAVVVFNGMMYPEAVARWIARQQGLRVITHEVGLQPNSAFFTEGDATAYPIDIPDDFSLSPEQNARLDAYLEQRFQGKFSMAGIRFWPEMNGLNDVLQARSARFQQLVPIFTNVIFDTSQAHANSVYPHMFAWLDSLLEIIPKHFETLFVLRAHPDETRPGKASRESVQDWAEQRKVRDLPNVEFIGPDEYVSSYELVRRAKFVMVYNSSIGLEASLMGAAVLGGGKARYTQLPTVFFPQSVGEYLQQAEAFLAAEEVRAPEEFRLNARRFLYYQLFRTSLPFDRYIAPNPDMPGFVRLKKFHWQHLTSQVSPVMEVLVEGILEGKPFILAEKEDVNGQLPRG